MRLARSLRARTAAVIAGAVLGTLTVFGAATAVAIYLHDRDERAAFGNDPRAAGGWVGDDLAAAKRLGLAVLLSAPIAVAIAALVGWLAAGRALSPMREAARRARESLDGAGPLELPVRGVGDEWDDLAEVTNELLRAQRQRVERLRSFSSSAAHELRTPLTAVLGEVEVARRRERTPEEYRAVLAVVEAEGKRLAALVDRLLTLSRADSGTLGAQVEPVDVMAKIRRATGRALGAHPGREVTFTEPVHPVAVLCDPVLTGRILENLVDNAIRHGGARVEVQLEERGDRVRICVADDGAGIAPEVRERLFERFNRERGATSGFGLGLSIARALAESQGGRLWLDETAPGTRFVLELPAAVLPG